MLVFWENRKHGGKLFEEVAAASWHHDMHVHMQRSRKFLRQNCGYWNYPRLRPGMYLSVRQIYDSDGTLSKGG